MDVTNLSNDPMFHTKAGRLTPYALSCGYQEVHTKKRVPVGTRMDLRKGGLVTRLYMEHGVYVVSKYDHDEKVRIHHTCHRTLSEARKMFDNLNRWEK